MWHNSVAKTKPPERVSSRRVKVGKTNFYQTCRVLKHLVKHLKILLILLVLCIVYIKLIVIKLMQLS